jgi:alpha-tubulin suppressor-like RCC1 family protein
MSTNFRALANSIFRKTAWLASAALVATLLVAIPVSQTAAVATEAAIAPSSISVGAYHSCAVVDGGVNCWGYNGDGQLGVDGIAASATAVQAIAPESGVWQVSAGGDHSCALFEDGAIKCWGNNYSGELGNGTRADSYEPSNVLITADDVETVEQDETVELTGATQISAGDSHTCALVNGGVKCWGENGSYGQLGVDSDDQNTAVDVLEGRDPLAGAT